MCISLIQSTIIYVSLYIMILNAECRLIKRSPLEIGFVTFPEAEKHRHIILLNKTTTEISYERNGLSGDDLALSMHPNKIAHTHEWIPGQIRHHSYIPAHTHHIFVPLLIASTVETVIVRPEESTDYEFYPKPVGGYGPGSYTGGQGAGHGFQILFNNL